jgi:hypothetical protein
MHEATSDALLALINQLDTAGQLRLRLALVAQALSYAWRGVGARPDPAERACLDVVARWLEQPDEPAHSQAIAAQLTLEQRLEDRGESTVTVVWDAARATRVGLPEAARLAVAAAGEVASLDLKVNGVEAARGRRAAALQAERVARNWQLAAARAILAGAEPPPLPALPTPPSDAAVWAILLALPQVTLLGRLIAAKDTIARHQK